MPNGITEWLEGIGLGQYAQAFEENAITCALLPQLTDNDLKELGVAALGHRKLIIGAIDKLSDDLPAAESDGSTRDPSRIRTPDEAERRQLTVLFCDLVGSTALSARLDPEDMRDLLRAYQNTVAGEITRFEGHIAKFMGDGVLCYFGWPRAHEDDAERAVRAALAIMRAMASLAASTGESLKARAGVSTGLVVVGDLIGEGAAQEEVVVGDTPNLAARLQAAAAPGEIIVSEATRNLLGELFDFDAQVEQKFKGLPTPVQAFTVRGERELESRFAARHGHQISTMVGRDQELALLSERWRLAQAGEGQMVLLTGEAGIGKSRVTRALIDEVSNDEHIRVNYQCSPYHVDSALYPAIQQLRLAARIDPADCSEVKLDKLEALLSRAVDNVTNVAPLLAELIGIESETRYGRIDLLPQQQRTRTLEALADQLIGLARNHPVLFVLEDAHWIDPTTLELIEIALDRLLTVPVLILITARPTFEHSFGGHPIVTRLALNRLGREQIKAIISRLTGDKALPEDLLTEITSKTDGIPLFVEEFTKTVLESGILRDTPHGFVFDRPLDAVAIPASLHDSLMARLDRLKPVKEVAQLAACIGREFNYRLIARIARLPEARLIHALDQLAAAELVFRRGVPPDATYMFKHALVRDAAYESLLKGRRQALHAQILEVLEADGTAAPEILAHHATEANLLEKAIEYWRLAGANALSRPAYREATGHLTNALNLLRHLGDDRYWCETELELQISLGQALIASQGYAAPKTTQAFSRALKLAESLGETPELYPALYGVWAARYIRGEPARDIALRFMKLAENEPDTGPRLVALRTLALERFHEGHFEETLSLVDQILDGYDTTAHADLALRYGHDARAAALSYRAWVLCQLGFFDQAQCASVAALNWSYERDHGNTTGYALCWGGVVPMVLLRRYGDAINIAKKAIAVCDEFALPLWRGWAKIFLGWALANQGEAKSGLVEIEAGLAESRATGSERLMPFCLGLAAEAHAENGDLEAAYQTIQNGFSALESTRDVAWEAGLYCLRGDILCREPTNRNDAGIEDFHRAIDLARVRKAKSVELRATTHLARAWHSRGRSSEARDLLAPIYNWFTEGFDTADLKQAKALLDQLS